MKAIATNSFHAWILAARPKTLTGAVIPVLTGSALAFADEAFNIIPALLCALFACGMQIAAKMLQRHHTLTNFLVDLGVDPETAEEDACKMEHDISDQTFRAICDHARTHLSMGKKAEE